MCTLVILDVVDIIRVLKVIHVFKHVNVASLSLCSKWRLCVELVFGWEVDGIECIFACTFTHGGAVFTQRNTVF